jgi:DNA-binding transcriptional LysR family regulator
MEFEHVHLQLEAAVNGLGIALASLPLIEKDIESGRLVCPIREPEWCSQDYVLISGNCEEDAAVKAFRTWITKNKPLHTF